MKTPFSFRQPVLGLALATLLAVHATRALAVPLVLSTAPAGADHKPPAPNLIVSIHDAGHLPAVRDALAAALGKANAPDGSVRLAWQASGDEDCHELPSARCANLNGMRNLDSRHRAQFLRWLGSLRRPGVTSARRMLRHAGAYLEKPPDAESPWANVPGKLQEPVLGCRKSHNLFVSAGTGHHAESLSDLALHYWSTDLQPAVADKVEPAHPEDSATAADPATWQHLNVHAVAFGKGALDDELERVAIQSRGRFVDARDGATLAEAVKRTVGEIISHRSLPVTSFSAAAHSAAWGAGVFETAYDATRWSGHVAAYKVEPGAARLDPTGLWGADKASRPHTTASRMDAMDDQWPARRLVLSARTDPGSDAAVGISWEWALLTQDAKASLMAEDAHDAPEVAEAMGRSRLAYLRGDRSREQSSTRAGPFRKRASRHGDIVNSRIWYLEGRPSGAYTRENHAGFRATAAARPPMLYVGANDGMLHGFDATTGEEKIAYVPEGRHAGLVALTRPGYVHAYHVDGSPFSGDLYLGPRGSSDPARWRTYLAGFPGAGGRGYFVLDVTDPGAFAAENAAGLVVLDRTSDLAMDPDIGHLTGEPVSEPGDAATSRQITQMNDGRWALVMGNGYNSRNENAVLLIQYLDGAKELRKIPTGKADGRGNGLSAARLVDLNGDRIADVAYAGDLLGQLWKFDLSATDPGAWHVAFSGQALFTARGPGQGGAAQPITTAPVWKAHPEGGLMLAFGTGRNLSVADRADTRKQTVYGIHDDTRVSRAKTVNPLTGSGTVTLDGGSAIVDGRRRLVEQTVNVVSVASEVETRSALWTLSSNPVAFTGKDAARGWFIDLPAPRERVLRNPGWFDGDLIDIVSTVPAQSGSSGVETCDPAVAAAKGYRTLLDIMDGSAPKSPIYAAVPEQQGAQPSRVESSSGSVGVRSGTREAGLAAPGMPSAPSAALLGKVMKRASWHQLQ